MYLWLKPNWKYLCRFQETLIEMENENENVKIFFLLFIFIATKPITNFAHLILDSLKSICMYIKKVQKSVSNRII